MARHSLEPRAAIDRATALGALLRNRGANPLNYTISPKQGLVKPTTRPRPKLGYRAMGSGKTRRRKTPSLLRGVIANNLTARARRVFPASTNIPMDIRRASSDTERDRLTKSTIQRIMAGETSATLEQIEGLAKALDVSPYQLLIPDLDARNPQVAKGATAAEESLYRKIAHEAVEEALARSRPGLSRTPKAKQ